MMTNILKKAISVLLSICLLLSAAACGKAQPAVKSTTEPEKTVETASEPAEEASSEEEASTAEAVDLSAFPVSLLGQSVKTYQDKFVDINGDTYFENACQFELRDLYPRVYYLTSSVKTEYNTLVPKSDAAFETLYTSADTELYPELKTGMTYRDYAGKFFISPCTYKEAYCCYSSTFKIEVNGRPATVYLFFWDADSVCRSIIITIDEKLEFSTLNVKEEDRESYPAVYIGQNALDMQQAFAGVYTNLSGYDTDLRKHMYLGIIPEEPAKPISQDALVMGVHLFSDEYEAVPGVRIGDSAPGAGFTKYQQEEGDSFYYGTFLIGGFFAETYVMVQDDNFSGFEFLCKQLYEN